jgi:hypothetical protein
MTKLIVPFRNIVNAPKNGTESLAGKARTGCKMTNQMVRSVHDFARYDWDTCYAQHSNNRGTTVSGDTFRPEGAACHNVYCLLQRTICRTVQYTPNNSVLLPHSVCACIKLPAAAAGTPGRHVSNEPYTSSSCDPRKLSSSTAEVFSLCRWKPTLM